MTTIKGNEKKNKDPQNITPIFLRLVKIAMSSFVIELGVKMTIDVNNF
jgi:hypothetical protein